MGNITQNTKLTTLFYSQHLSQEPCLPRTLLENSPSTIFLYVLDKWFEEEVNPRLINRGSLIRYADDVVLLMKNEKDSRRVMDVLSKRFSRFGLTLHPEKTRLAVFKPNKKYSIDLLGFTHYWKRGRTGAWGIPRKTMKSKLARSIKAIKEWGRFNRHKPLQEQQAKLCQKVKGHYAYFGISGNLKALKNFLCSVQRVWTKWLRRRSQKHRLDWKIAHKLLLRYSLPAATIKPRNLQMC